MAARSKTSKKPKLGRPPLPLEKRKRVTLGFRPTPEMHRRLEAAMKQSGLSLTQEVERRLDRSFQEDDADDRVRRATMENAYESFGGEHYYGLGKLIVGVFGEIEAFTGKSWRRDFRTRELIFAALAALFAKFGGKPGEGDRYMGFLERADTGRELLEILISEPKDFARAQSARGRATHKKKA